MVLSVLFVVSDSARAIKLASSDRSLFFEMSRKVMPWLKPIIRANFSKPTSEKAFRPMSICLNVLLLGKNLARI